MCACITGYTDDSCTTIIDDYSPNPYENNGTCLDLVNDFSFQSLAGYTGATCVVNIDNCSPNPCENNDPVMIW